METLDAIFDRRSIRKYKSNTVSPDKIETIIRAGMAAPSARNDQTWHFVVIDDRETLDKIADFHPHGKMLYHAPIAILVCADMSLAKAPDYFREDMSATTENMLLAIHDLGLGGVWLAVYPREDRIKNTSDLFNFPKDVIPFSLISFGYLDEHKEPSNRFIKERIHINKW